jgi:Protein of unknown function (DUF3052)
MTAERAGYSQRTLVEKLGIKAGHRIALVAAPPGFNATLGPLPGGVRRARDLRGAINVIVFFARDSAGLVRAMTSVKRALASDGMLWVTWPKKSSGVASDLDENIVRAVGLAAGLVDVKVCAVDATWSGLKFVYRLRDRPAAVTPRRARRRR